MTAPLKPFAPADECRDTPLKEKHPTHGKDRKNR